MSRLFRTTMLLALVAACGGGNFSAPRNLDNACSIMDQRPTFLKAMQRSQRTWGIP
ncbi:MAG: transglycosylase SLT domain-containing protein, partial [Paracoccaceae bacterium]